jgi:hypothetical protein
MAEAGAGVVKGFSGCTTQPEKINIKHPTLNVQRSTFPAEALRRRGELFFRAFRVFRGQKIEVIDKLIMLIFRVGYSKKTTLPNKDPAVDQHKGLYSSRPGNDR